MMRLGCVQLWLLATFATTIHGRVLRPRILRPRDTTYTASIRDETIFGTFGQALQTTTVDPGVTYWLSGEGPHNLFGNIVNSGSIVVSQTSDILGTGITFDTPLAVTYASTGTDGILVTNAGSLISLNDYGDTSLVSPSLYNWALLSMQNAGTLQWCGNGNPPTGSTFTLTCATNTCINNGLITWEQYTADNGVAFTWNAGVNPTGGTTTGTFTPTNNGAFRLINTDLQVTQNIISTVSGGGCFVLGTNGLISLLAGTQGATSAVQTFAGQSIYFTTTTAGLYINPAVYALNTNFGAALYGFGTGNYIAFSEPLTIANPITGATPYTYSGSTLKVNFLSGTSISINIGTGYTASSFKTTLVPDALRLPYAVVAILYNAAAPARTVPTVCAVTYPVCADPAVTVTAAFASTIGASSSTLLSTTASLPVTTSLPITTSLPVTTSLPITTSLPDTTSLPVTTSLPITTSLPDTTSLPTITSLPDTTSPSLSPTLSTTSDAPGTTTIFVTSTSYSAGLGAAFTSTIPPTATGPGVFLGTVEVVVPATYVTVSVESLGATAPTTYTVQPTGTDPGTIVVVDPTNINTVTTTAPYTGSDIYTSAVTYSTVQPSGTAPGTVYVSIVDAELATITRPYTGSATITTTVVPTGQTQAVVEVLTPTISRPATISTTIGPNKCFCTPRTTCAF